MKNILILLFNLSALTICLDAQPYFSKRFDAGNTNFYNNIKFIVEENDTMYYVAFNVCNLTDSSFVECSVVGRMDKEGNMLKEASFGWLDPNQQARPIFIDGNNLLINDGLFEQNGEPIIRLLILDKYSLDSIAAFDYRIDKPVHFYEDTGVLAYHNYYILTGWSESASEEGQPYLDWCIWIDKQTMEIDTIMNYPFEYFYGKYNFISVDKDNFLSVYYDIHRPKGIGNGLPESRGFIKYDTNKNVVFHYQDTLVKYESGPPLIPVGLQLSNGNMAYRQQYETEDLDTFPFTDLPSDFDILCIDKNSTIKWRFHEPGFNRFGVKKIYSLSETKDGDILGCGTVRWYFNAPIFFDIFDVIESSHHEDDPDNSDFYNAPYIIKIDGQTGELIWQYALVEFDKNGNVGANYLSEFFELSDGSLFGGGGYQIKDEQGQSMSFDSWVVRLAPNICPSDGITAACAPEEMECTFESFLTDTEDIALVDISAPKRVLVYPNPIKNVLYLRPLVNNLRNINLRISNLSGQIFLTKRINLLDTETINISNLPNNILIIELYDNLGRLIQTDKLIRM